MKKSVRSIFYFPKQDGDIKGIFRQNHKLHVLVEGNTHPEQIQYEKYASNVLNDKNGSFCWYSPVNDPVLTISFQPYSLMITNYTIQGPSNQCTVNCPPKKWDLYGYNGENWVLISSQSSNMLNNEQVFITFTPNKITHMEAFNKFKFVGDNTNDCGKILVIQSLDFFGVLYDDRTLTHCVSIIYSYSFLVLSAVFILIK